MDKHSGKCKYFVIFLAASVQRFNWVYVSEVFTSMHLDDTVHPTVSPDSDVN